MNTRNTTLVLPDKHYNVLRSHFFPGDGLEAAALLLCTVAKERRTKLIVQNVVTVPYSACERRTRNSITWPGDFVERAIDRAERQGLSIIAAHSHPQGGYRFSGMDDESDRVLMQSLICGTEQVCGSAIMVPNGAVRARLYAPNLDCWPVGLVACPGSKISLWWDENSDQPGKTPTAFTSEMTAWLGRLSACVIGVSGTGSIVAEQLVRLGFGEVIVIDFDKIELRNLNRILNATRKHAESDTLKVDVFALAAQGHHPDCDIIRVPVSIDTRDAVLAALDADVLFSCVDTAEGRHIADRICAYFSIPLFDVGVSIPTRRNRVGKVDVAEVCGRIDYVFPGGSTLQDRDVYDAMLLEAEYLARIDPEAHRKKVSDGYLRGAAEHAPAVISLNMRAASACVMEFIARMFPFRHFPSDERARTIFMLAEGEEEYVAESAFPRSESFPVGAGTLEPLIGLPSLAKRREAA